MYETKSFFACLLLVSAILLHCEEAKETEVQALVGSDILLPCRVDVKQCGTVHSVKWYRDIFRIYVFSQGGQIRRGEGDASERVNLTYNEPKNEAFLQIASVKIDDEATYKCEITYLEVVENCGDVQIVKLTTLVKPTDVILTYNDKEVNESTKLEEKNQGEAVILTCKAPGGKPIPTVSWYNGSQLINMASYSTRSDGNNGTGTGISKLQFTLSRGDLNARFDCKVESQALDEPIIRGITLPVKVSPTKIELSGVSGHVNQGTLVTLLCQVFGARPMAEVEWYNGTLITANNSRGIDLRTIYEPNRDGTFTTKSSLIFVATRYENLQKFECLAKNEVSVNKGDPDLQGLIFLDVRYPPVITIGTKDDTVVREGASIVLSCKYLANPQKLEFATWVKDGKNVKITERHKGGDVQNPTLTIVNITREDMGEYRCLLQNSVNTSLSEEMIFLDVHYPLDVEVIMEPPTPANATEMKNVTLVCNISSGNPQSFRKVSWFLNSELMATLPECNYNQSSINDTLGGPFCGIDPSILSLIFVDKEFAGNYTCQGENEAGLGRISAPHDLVVYYPPSNVTLTHSPKTVMKKGQVTLSCSVKDKGFPPDVEYLWFRNGHMIHNITGSKWTIPHASLETRSKFSCIPWNKGGQGEPAFDSIDVEAPPALITKDNTPYKGVLYSSKNMSLTCRIECSPLCSIKWFKDGHEINFERNSLYYVVNTTHEADYKKNDFESIESTLVWNITNWPGQQLDKSANDSSYMCASYDPPERHRVGVNYTTVVGVEYPPEKVTVFPDVVNVTENVHIQTNVKCGGNGRPNLSYVWKNLTSHVIMKGETLKQTVMTKSSAGYYFCEAFNKHGNKTARVFFNVWYKPECNIERGQEEDTSALICRARGNPSEMTFAWKMIEQNETTDLTTFGTRLDYSYVFLDPKVDKTREYLCVANNSIKSSDPCSIEIPGNKTPWYHSKENLIVIVASIVTLIVCVIVVCIIIIVLCRRKRQNTKSPNPSSTGDKMRLGAAPPVGGSADPANDHDKGFYENLPFHGMQNPPNKPISVIAPFTQETTRNFPQSAKSLSPTAFAPCHKIIQRHRSFHGFQNNQQMRQMTNFGFDLNRSNPYLFGGSNLRNKNFYAQNITNQQVAEPFAFQSNFQPILNFNPFLLPNPFSIPPRTNRVAGRRETDIRRTASGINISEREKPKGEGSQEKIAESKPDPDNDKRFGSLELKKHKCYSPTFYSMRCKKHAKKRPIVYALPKKVFGDLKPTEERYQDVTDSIQIFEHKSETAENKTVPVPAPRCRKHRRKEIIYQNVSQQVVNVTTSSPNPDVSNSSNDGSEMLESEISVIEAQVHSSNELKTETKPPDGEVKSPPKLVGVYPKLNLSTDSATGAVQALKNSPILKVSPNVAKLKTDSPKGSLSSQIQARLKSSNDKLNHSDDSSKENLPLIPQMPLLNPQSKWSPGLASANRQNAFYTLTTPHYKHINVGLPPQYSATIPHQKHTKLIPRALFDEPLPKSKSFSSKPKHKKHFQIPLQKCHSFKFQTAESYFQPIRNIHEEDLMKNGYVSDYPESSSRGRHHKREKPKQKTKGPLVVMRPNEYHGSIQFPESVHNSVQLQYPQPVLGRSAKKPNGVVYADLDMPKTNSKKSSHETSSSSQSKTQKSKPKTEYATLSFNDVGQEIDV